MVVDAIKRSLGCCSKLFSTFIKLKKNALLWLEKLYFEIQKNNHFKYKNSFWSLRPIKNVNLFTFFWFVLHFLDTLASEPLLPPRSSPVCNNPEHSDFTTSWWWKLGKDLLAVALKRLLLSKCNYYKAKKWLLQPNFFK